MQKQVQLPNGKPEANTPADHSLPPKANTATAEVPADFLPPRNLQHFGDQYPSSNPFAGDVTMSTTMPTELINQMMNCSYQQHQQPRFTSNNPFDDDPSSSQSYERNLKFQQQQQIQMMKRDFYNSAGLSSSSSTSSSLSAYEASMQAQYSMMNS